MLKLLLFRDNACVGPTRGVMAVSISFFSSVNDLLMNYVTHGGNGASGRFSTVAQVIHAFHENDWRCRMCRI